MPKIRLTVKQREALAVAEKFGYVCMARQDGLDHIRPDHYGRVTLESLRGRDLLEPVDGPHYMLKLKLTDAGREAIGATTTTPSAKTYVVEFTRIGRRRGVEPLTVKVPAGKSVMEAVLPAVGRYARRFLLSGQFDVTMDRDQLSGMIEYGRYGQFTVKEA